MSLLPFLSPSPSHLIPPQILVPGFGSAVENPFNNEDGEEPHRDEAGEAEECGEDGGEVRWGVDVLEHEWFCEKGEGYK